MYRVRRRSVHNVSMPWKNSLLENANQQYKNLKTKRKTHGEKKIALWELFIFLSLFSSNNELIFIYDLSRHWGECIKIVDIVYSSWYNDRYSILM